MIYSFDSLDFSKSSGFGGPRAVLEFPNGYAVSVIAGPQAYGGSRGLYELAVLRDGSCCYDTPVTDDVLGHLTEEAVTAAMQEVAAPP